MYDIIIKNGRIIDGTASPAYLADVAIKDGKIARIAKNLEGAEKIIDAKGLVVTPGFIDSHSHSDTTILCYPDQTEKVEQGITTSIGGQCGASNAPTIKGALPGEGDEVAGFGRFNDVYATMGSFLGIAKNVPLGSNIATCVGHSALRKAALGYENRKPTPEELEKMKSLARDAFEAGAVGLSFGLIYSPGCFADTEELIELAKVAAEYDRVVAAHIRNEGVNLIQSVEEFITVVRSAGVRGVISHHKAAAKENWGKVNTTLRMIEKANLEGLEIYCDVYPYIASHTTLSTTLIPKEYHDDGKAGIDRLLDSAKGRETLKAWGRERWGDDLSWILITSCDGYPEYCGLRINEIAKLHGTDEYDAAYDMIRNSNHTSSCFFTMCEEDVETVMAYPRAMIGTDSSVKAAKDVYHPRLRGTFPRVLGRYVRERGVVSLPEMIRKMTSMPAAVYGLTSKGLIAEGFDADICIFDPDKIIDRAEYTSCHERAEGLSYVLVGGKVAAENAVFNGTRNGRVILFK